MQGPWLYESLLPDGNVTGGEMHGKKWMRALKDFG